MIEVKLDSDEWQRVLAILAQAPWAQANPLIMKIGEQLRRQAGGLPINQWPGPHIPRDAKGRPLDSVHADADEKGHEPN